MEKKIDDLIRSFSPLLPFSWAHDKLRLQKEVPLKNGGLLTKVKELAAKAEPSFHDSWDTNWKYFYLPMERENQLICSPFSINMHRGEYSLFFYGFTRGHGYLSIEEGSDTIDDNYFKIIDETNRFLPLLQETQNQVLEKIFPHEWRQGRVQRKFTRPATELMPIAEAEKIKKDYRAHLEKKLTITEICLQDYLDTAAICYRAAFADDIKRYARQLEKEDLTPRELIRYWADSRHGGMLTLKDPNSKKEYMDWLNSGEWDGAHPFEIVYSTPHGIYIYPPEEQYSFYRLSIADPFYNKQYVRMIVSLMANQVPFQAYGLDEALGYLTGENFVDVNTMSMESFRYDDDSLDKKEKEKYFPFIEWNPITTLKMK